MLDSLSPNHPLHVDPMKPWPYMVLIGYRAMGNRKIVASRSVYIRASGEDQARLSALREARAMIPMTKDGKRLKASRIVSSRPLDRGDAINGEPSQ